MAYTDPRTWVTGELVTASLMNVQIRDNLDAVIEGTTGAYVNAVTGPHAIGGSTVDYVRLGLTGAFTSGGASTVAFGTYTSGVLTGHSGDSAAIAGVKLNNTIVTAGNCTTIAQLWVSEPQITVGAGSVTNSASIYVEGSASEASNDYSIWVDSGVTKLDGAVTTGSTVTVGTDLTVTEDLVVSGAGPHAIGGAIHGAVAISLRPLFTSDGSSSVAIGIDTDAMRVTGVAGDTTHIVGAKFAAAMTVQDVSETVNSVAQVFIEEPAITKGASATITNASTLQLVGVPTEATNNYALWVDSTGVSRFDGEVYSTAWTDYYSSSTIVGWSSLTSGRRQIMYRTLGDMVWVSFHLEGVSNSTSATFTVPYTAVAIATSHSFSIALGFTYDNSVYLDPGYGRVSNNENVFHCMVAGANTGAPGWTASGSKIVEGEFWYVKA